MWFPQTLSFLKEYAASEYVANIMKNIGSLYSSFRNSSGGNPIFSICAVLQLANVVKGAIIVCLYNRFTMNCFEFRYNRRCESDHQTAVKPDSRPWAGFGV